MLVRSWEVHSDPDRAKFGVVTAARDLGLEFDCRLASMWRVSIDGDEREVFLEIAKEKAGEM
jgi:hypothetical protein